MRSSSLVRAAFGSLVAVACHRGGPVEASPVTLEPTSAPTSEARADAGASPSVPAPEITELHPVALRDGPLALFEVDGRAYLSMDGEPIALHPGETPQREPRLGEGLLPREAYFGYPTFEVVAFAGDPRVSGSAHLVIAEHFDRAGSSFTTYRLASAGWRQVTRSYEMLSEYYPELISLPGGAVLGLRSYNLDVDDVEADFDYDEADSDGAAFWGSVDAALSSAPKGFAVLAGEHEAPPELPPGSDPIDLAGDRSGNVFALVEGADDEGDTDTRLLHWEPGDSEATTLALPGRHSSSASLYGLALWSTGERVFVGGFESLSDEDEPSRLYLAAGSGSSWTRIPVELLGLDDPWDLQVTSVAQTDAGEVWLTTGDQYVVSHEPGVPRLWRQREGSWEPVALEPVAFEADAGTRWVRDPLESVWVELPPARPAQTRQDAIQATAVVWAEGTLWILADVGPAFLDSSGSLIVEERRSVLYASRPASPAELPSYDRVHRERLNGQARARALEPGQPSCEQFSIVLLDDPDGAHARERDAILARYAALDGSLSIDGGYVDSLLVGRVGEAGPEQLVLEVRVDDPKAARKMRAEVERRLEARGRADCQIRELVRMIDGW